MNQQESEPVEQSKTKLGPGDRLQTARISIGMTVEEVASKMHLSTCILTSLEENNFDEITAPIFVKGYLRAYSRIVNLNEDEIIEQYSSYYLNGDGDPPITSTSNTSPEINSDDPRVKWITYIIIIGLIALLSTWWWNRYQQAPEKVSLEGDNNIQTDVLAFDKAAKESPKDMDITTEKKSLQHEIKSVVDSLGFNNQKTDEPDILLQDSSETTEEKPDSNEPEVVASVADEIMTDTVISQETAVDETTIETFVSDEKEAEGEPTENENKNDLVITVNADTWASIKDVNGNKLVYDLLRSGEVISVSGKTPISVFLGNGYGVVMQFKGKDVDLSDAIRANNTARLTIGK